MRILIREGKMSSGPHTKTEVEEMLRSGKISRNARFWTEGMGAYAPVADLNPTKSIPMATETPKGRDFGTETSKWRDFGKLVATVIIALLVAALVAFLGASLYPPKKPSQRTSAHAATTPFASVEQSDWDGSVSQVKRWISRNAHDPQSVEFVQWGKLKSDVHGYEVTVQFRAKNALGVKVLDQKTFRLSRDGDIAGVQ